jgi:hypothetical protein
MQERRWRKMTGGAVCVVVGVAGSAITVGCGSESKTAPPTVSAATTTTTATTVQPNPVDSLPALIAS